MKEIYESILFACMHNRVHTSQSMCIALLAILRLHVFPKVYRGKLCVQLKEYLRKVFIVNERFCEKCSLRMNTLVIH